MNEPASTSVQGDGERSAKESKGEVGGTLRMETGSWKERRGDIVVVVLVESGAPGTFARVSPARPSVTRMPRITTAVAEALGEDTKRGEDALFLL